MQNNITLEQLQELEEKPFDLRGFLFKFILRYWYLYFIFPALSFLGAWLYLRYTIPKYESKAVLLIKDPNNDANGAITEGEIIKDLGLFSAAVIPGLTQALFYLVVVWLLCRRNPARSRPMSLNRKFVKMNQKVFLGLALVHMTTLVAPSKTPVRVSRSVISPIRI